jgi:hypothetical protein
MNLIEAWIEGLEARRGRYVALLAIVGSITLLSLFLAYPGPIVRDLLPRTTVINHPDRFMEVYLPLAEEPFRKQIDQPWLRHRLLCPLIAYLLHLRGRSSIFIELIPNPLIYLITYLLVLGKSRRCTAFATAVVLSLTLACVTSQAWPGYQDSMAYLFLLLAMVISSPPLSAACVMVGMFADERILAAGLLVILWHLVKDGPPPAAWKREVVVRGIWLAAAGALWFAGYLFIKHATIVNSSTYQRDALVSPIASSDRLWLAWYFGLRGGWLPVCALMFYSVSQRNFGIVAALAVAIAPIFAESTLVADRSRVAATAFPALLISAVMLYRQRQLLANHMLLAAMLIQVTTPIHSVVLSDPVPINPTPFGILVDLFAKPVHAATTAPAP